MSPPIEVRDQHVRIADLVVTTDFITERWFVNCVIEGPAIVVMTGAVGVDTCVFDLGGAPPEGMLYDIPFGRPCIGMVALGAVQFEGCTFRRVGFAGTPEALAPFRAMPQP